MLSSLDSDDFHLLGIDNHDLLATTHRIPPSGTPPPPPTSNISKGTQDHHLISYEEILLIPPPPAPTKNLPPPQPRQQYLQFGQQLPGVQQACHLSPSFPNGFTFDLPSHGNHVSTVERAQTSPVVGFAWSDDGEADAFITSCKKDEGLSVAGGERVEHLRREDQHRQHKSWSVPEFAQVYENDSVVWQQMGRNRQQGIRQDEQEDLWHAVFGTGSGDLVQESWLHQQTNVPTSSIVAGVESSSGYVASSSMAIHDMEEHKKERRHNRQIRFQLPEGDSGHHRSRRHSNNRRSSNSAQNDGQKPLPETLNGSHPSSTFEDSDLFLDLLMDTTPRAEGEPEGTLRPKGYKRRQNAESPYKHPAPAPTSSTDLPTKRRYKCPVTGCNQTFSTSGHRTRHIRTHTNERPFEC
ncbi:hypothetical protein HK102_014188, partial [Quaeritorhiza haematococci]